MGGIFWLIWVTTVRKKERDGMGATMKKNPNQSEELAEIEEKIKHIFIYIYDLM